MVCAPISTLKPAKVKWNFPMHIDMSWKYLVWWKFVVLVVCQIKVIMEPAFEKNWTVSILLHSKRHSSWCWNRQFGCETIHPSPKFTSMTLLQIWHFNSIFGSSHSASSAYQRFKKWGQLKFIHSEKATKFYEIFTFLLTGTT